MKFQLSCELVRFNLSLTIESSYDHFRPLYLLPLSMSLVFFVKNIDRSEKCNEVRKTKEKFDYCRIGKAFR